MWSWMTLLQQIENVESNLERNDTVHIVFANISSGHNEWKCFNVVLVKNNEKFWFAKVNLPFQLSTDQRNDTQWSMLLSNNLAF